MSTDSMRTFEEAPWISLLPNDERAALERVEADPEGEEWAALVAADRTLEDDFSRPSRSSRLLVPLAVGGLLAAILLALDPSGAVDRAAPRVGRARPARARSQLSPRCPSGTGSCSPRAPLRPQRARRRLQRGQAERRRRNPVQASEASRRWRRWWRDPDAAARLDNASGGQVSVPGIQVPSVQVPPITVPPIQVPGVQLPPVQTPPISLPPVQLPPLQLPQLPPLLPPPGQ